MSRSCAVGPQWSWKRAGRGRDTGARHRRQRQHWGRCMQAPRGRRPACLRPREQPLGAGREACDRDHCERGVRGITVNAVEPGIIESAMTESVFSRDAIEKFVPMKRAGTPEEVAELIGFLASERAAYISGQIISINGAMI